MHNNVFSLIPQIELDVISSYFSGISNSGFNTYYENTYISPDATPPEIDIVVARVILKSIQNTLPQWASVSADYEVSLNREEIKRIPQSKHKLELNFSPKLICCINWADSGPGFSWPEAYHITYIPDFKKYIVTSSRDGDDVYGCADHAIGWGELIEGELEIAKRCVLDHWSSLNWEQERWAYVFDEGIIDSKIATEWANEIWG